MDWIASTCTRLSIKPKHQPLLESLRKQNEQFEATENTKLLMEESDAQDDEDDFSDLDDEDLENASGRELAMGMLHRMAKMFEYTSINDRCILLLGLISTCIHAASFPILAILFGKISNAYILHVIREMKNTTLHSSTNVSNPKIGATGHLALSFLTKVTSKVTPKFNASEIPGKAGLSDGGYFKHVSLYNSNGTETIGDFATYIDDFSLYFVYIGIAVFFASFFQTLSWEWVAEIQLYRIKQKYIYQLQRQEMPWFRRRAAGNLLLKMADDCERFREGIGQKFVLVIEYVTIALYGAGLGFITNTKLTLVFLAAAPFILTKLVVLWQKMAEQSAISQKEYAKAGKICSEILTGIKTVAALAREKKEVARYKAALLKGCRAAEKRELLSGVGIGGMYFLIFAFYAVALWYSVNLLAEGVITPGEIYTVFFSLTICAFAIGSVLPYVNLVASSYASFKLLTTVLDSVPDIDPYSTKGEQPRNFTGKIKFANINFTYPGSGGASVFKEFDLEIPGNGITAIVGRGGKGSLLNLMLRFHDPQRGRVMFDNRDIKTLNVRWIREQISTVNKNAALYNTTIFENIRSYRKDITMERVMEVAGLVKANHFIKRLPEGYNTRVKLSGGSELAMGQRIQIQIAKFMISNPKILVLNKIMSSLGNLSEPILKALADSRKNLTTIILDNKAAVARNANHIIVLKDYHVIEQGTHEALYAKRGEYYKMLQLENVADEEETPEVSHIPWGFRGRRGRFERPTTMADVVSVLKLKQKVMALQDKKLYQEEIFKRVPPIRKVLGLMPKATILLYIGIFGCILSGLVIPFLAVCLGQTLSMFLGNKEDLFETGIFWVKLLIGLAILAGIGYFTRTIFIGMAGEQLSLNLRVASYESILRQPMSWFDIEETAPGFLYARLNADIPFIRNAVGPRLGTAISAITTMITGLIISAYCCWQLAIIASFTVPILVAGFYILRRVLRKSHVKSTGFRKQIIKMTNNIIKNIVAIQTECTSYMICQWAEESIYPVLVEGQKRAIVYSLVYASSECLMFLSFGLAFRLGSELLREGLVSILTLFTVFCVLTFGSLSLGQATSFIPEYFKARISSAHIFMLIDMKSSADPYDEGGAKPPIKGQIEFRDVVFSYPLTPDVKVFRGVNLTIPAGCTVGILGRAGGGKSSLFAILERFYDIESGEVLIDGVNIKDINFSYLRSSLGYVSQQPILFDMSIKENIVSGYHGDLTGEDLQNLVVDAANAADADFITDELPNQFATRCGEHGKHLSAEYRQGVVLARAVINNPSILLFDDPTSVLDSEEEKRVQRGLAQITKNRTTLLISNSYASIMHCEYIAVLGRGRILEFGKQTDLINSKSGFFYRHLQREGVV